MDTGVIGRLGQTVVCHAEMDISEEEEVVQIQDPNMGALSVREQTWKP